MPQQDLDTSTPRALPAGDRLRRAPRDTACLRCAACGLRYGGGAFARQPALFVLRTCRRCGGALEVEAVEAAALHRA